MAAPVEFTVTHRFDATPQTVWDEMVDWPGHGDWIPATHVDLGEGDPTSVGFEFVAYTGFGKLALVDRMRITQIDFDGATGVGRCEVEKLGPVLRGRAGFDLRPDGAGTELVWFEDVTVAYLPKPLAPIVSKVSELGFAQAMKSLAKVIAKRPASSPTVAAAD